RDGKASLVFVFLLFAFPPLERDGKASLVFVFLLFAFPPLKGTVKRVYFWLSLFMVLSSVSGFFCSALFFFTAP
ncbi:MAG: hypothetical protein ABIQ40_01260, partial [Bacteroidia bacterium]